MAEKQEAGFNSLRDAEIILQFRGIIPDMEILQKQVILDVINDQISKIGIMFGPNRCKDTFCLGFKNKESYDYCYDHVLIHKQDISDPIDNFHVKVMYERVPNHTTEKELISKSKNTFRVKKIKTNQIPGTGIYEWVFPNIEHFFTLALELFSYCKNLSDPLQPFSTA